ncbi:MAG: D-glycerate dehydrogenase [Patescibacteria group bacterium]
MKYKIFITRMIPDEGIKLLRKDKRINLEIYEKDKKIPRKELLKRIKGKDIVLTILTEKVDKKFFEAAGDQLKMVANYAVGFDNIDIEEAKKRGVTITNTPCEEVCEAVAEHAISLIFALMHRIVEADEFTRSGKYSNWSPTFMLGSDLKGKTVGILGSGRIGSAVVKRLHDGFRVNIVYNDVKRNPELEKITGAKYLSKMQLLKKSDVVSIHVPLLPSTRHLISTTELKAMKKNAILINTARGPVVDEKALSKALVSGQIGGAGLDVYECEPLIDCDPTDNLELRKMPNVVLTPHTASATIEARQAMSRVAAQNILAFIRDKKPPNAVN